MRRYWLVTLVLTTGCLGPRSDPSSFYLLSPTESGGGSVVPVVVGLGPVTLPPYLDRSQMVVRVGQNEIALSETERWGEPLRDNVWQTLRENLVGLLPGSSYLAYPWYASDAPDYAVEVEIRRFEADAGGAVVLEASWTVARKGFDEGGAATIEEESSGPGRASVVAAQSRALGTLSRDIASAIRRAEARR